MNIENVSPPILFRLKERRRMEEGKKGSVEARLPEREIKFKRSGSMVGSSALLNILISTRKVGNQRIVV